MNALKTSKRKMMAAGRVEDPIDNVNALKEKASKQEEEEDAESVVVDPVHIHAPILKKFGAIIVTEQDMLKNYAVKDSSTGFRMAG